MTTRRNSGRSARSSDPEDRRRNVSGRSGRTSHDRSQDDYEEDFEETKGAYGDDDDDNARYENSSRGRNDRYEDDEDNDSRRYTRSSRGYEDEFEGEKVRVGVRKKSA